MLALVLAIILMGIGCIATTFIRRSIGCFIAAACGLFAIPSVFFSNNSAGFRGAVIVGLTLTIILNYLQGLRERAFER